MGRPTKMNKICTPELLAQVNKENSKLLNEFVRYMRSIQRSENTIESYISDLQIFFVWLLQNADNKAFYDITKRDIVGYQAYLGDDNQNSPARIRRLKSSISSLSNYVENMCDDIAPNFRNIVNKVESPANEPVREKTVLTDEQIQTLLDYFSSNGQHQKACMVALAAYSGSRKSEIVRFKPSYFAPENIVFGSLYKTPEKIQCKGRGRNGKMLHRYVLVKEFTPYFDAWMKQREELGIDSPWLFVSRGADSAWQQMAADTLNSIAQTCSNVLSIDFYWHAARHMFVTRLLRLGLPETVVQSILGWSSADMVRTYDGRPQDEMLGQYFDENGIRQVEKNPLI